MENAEKEIRQLEKDLIAAILRRDAGFVERILAAELTYINPFGEIVGKEMMTNFDEKLVNESIETDEIKVNIFGTTAIVTGRASVKSRYKERDLSGRYRFTRVYLKRARWQIIAYHATRIAEK
ncbi:MAG TPA: nuclear transport factor 2 family protein [Pyrinomonadaceae bacterium]|jgi:ketosteroid isomerase-like protein